ncbi:hypothetical protein F7Q91_15895 [Vibrio chagasii]|uniref:DNA polymerase III subunit beta n=1 Tax=Vibrio chagasii TaxID=170679 RepID=A0A7V7NSD2_9VIBR|nr:hypothetical protein [Vibrio chagasii]KAB0478754.1 hypothetical protein F7Q91_15895 [Vibrio chagasii]
MKKLAFAACVVALAGCAAPQVEWQQDNQVEVSAATVTMKSNLWHNKMPTIGETQDKTLHGAIYLESDSELPATLAVESVTVKQGSDTLLVTADDLDLRTHSETQWEVAFVWQLEIDSEKPVDVAVELKDGETVKWLVEKDVKVDTVY